MRKRALLGLSLFSAALICGSLLLRDRGVPSLTQLGRTEAHPVSAEDPSGPPTPEEPEPTRRRLDGGMRVELRRDAPRRDPATEGLAIFRGTVVWTGNPELRIANARVRIVDLGTDEDLASAVTGEDGVFDLRFSPEPSRLPLFTQLQTECEEWVQWGSTGRVFVVDSVPYRAGPRIALEPGVEVRGKVTEVSGEEPIPGARLSDIGRGAPVVRTAADFAQRGMAGRARADAGGRFRLVIPDRDSVILFVDAEDHLPVRIDVRREDRARDLWVLLPRPGLLPVLECRVLDADGRPCPEAWATLTHLRDGPPRSELEQTASAQFAARFFGPRRGTTSGSADERGVLRATLPFCGVWRIRAWAEAGIGQRTIEFEKKETLRCDVRVSEACSLRGRAVNEWGAAVPGARVTVRLGDEEREGRTANDGGFFLTGFLAGESVDLRVDTGLKTSEEVRFTFRSPGDLRDVGILLLRRP